MAWEEDCIVGDSEVCVVMMRSCLYCALCMLCLLRTWYSCYGEKQLKWHEFLGVSVGLLDVTEYEASPSGMASSDDLWWHLPLSSPLFTLCHTSCFKRCVKWRQKMLLRLPPLLNQITLLPLSPSPPFSPFHDSKCTDVHHSR